MKRHRFHSICPYFAMFPESFAEHWIQKLTKPGQVVLDPFSGRGTTAFTALLLGRIPIACDINPVAYCLTKAKIAAPSSKSVLKRIDELERAYKAGVWLELANSQPEFFKVAFHQSTLAQLLFLRSTLSWKTKIVDGMMAALIMGALHGEANPNSPYFSNQMPRTISTKPAYSVRYWRTRGLVAPNRDAFSLLRNRVAFRYEGTVPQGDGKVYMADMRSLPLRLIKSAKADCVITSPPYLDVTSFEEDQWLRIWFLGGATKPIRNPIADDRHTSANRYWSFIGDMWRSLGLTVKDRGHVVIRLGSRSESAELMQKRLLATSALSGRRVKLRSKHVTELKRRQTDAFRPGTKGCQIELDCHFQFVN